MAVPLGCEGLRLKLARNRASLGMIMGINRSNPVVLSMRSWECAWLMVAVRDW